MACTKALSAFSCGAPLLPGLTNSRMIDSTLGGGVVSCAAAILTPPNSRYDPNIHPVIFFAFFMFMDADLPGRDVICGSDFLEGPGTKQRKEVTRRRAEIIPMPP